MTLAFLDQGYLHVVRSTWRDEQHNARIHTHLPLDVNYREEGFSSTGKWEEGCGGGRRRFGASGGGAEVRCEVVLHARDNNNLVRDLCGEFVRCREVSSTVELAPRCTVGLPGDAQLGMLLLLLSCGGRLTLL